jgi:pyruvate/2-oxoglutarate dehydrogenase complex dihydrolipoamide dehydrogenase (E3) component
MFDAVVIEAGPGGYTCAIQAAQIGPRACIIEKNGMCEMSSKTIQKKE